VAEFLTSGKYRSAFHGPFFFSADALQVISQTLCDFGGWHTPRQIIFRAFVAPTSRVPERPSHIFLRCPRITYGGDDRRHQLHTATASWHCHRLPRALMLLVHPLCTVA
jgi:hypothetical protein